MEAQSVELVTPDQDVVGSIPILSARFPLVGQCL